MFRIFKKNKIEKEDSTTEVILVFHTKSGYSALVETGKFWEQEISFDVPVFSKSEFEVLLNASNDLNNKKCLYYFLFSLIHPHAVPSTRSFYLCCLREAWMRASSKEFHVINLKCSMLDVVDYTEMESILNKRQFWHVCGLVLKAHKKADPNEIKEIGLAYLFLDVGVSI